MQAGKRGWTLLDSVLFQLSHLNSPSWSSSRNDQTLAENSGPDTALAHTRTSWRPIQPLLKGAMGKGIHRFIVAGSWVPHPRWNAGPIKLAVPGKH